ncbi:hypothetical protein N7510_005379 [Penicillium lagena]|uniref:uncharacterized protein n=1 Tax=Penicillium lagena TaxID=94218 RepID=UPI00253F9CDA|nr:uncharacterized protein N7510_005379 [Penicillium lagena]KAJ5612185.1 hypothetical protein N7510_005379 [Penicillium lagena]
MAGKGPYDIESSINDADESENGHLLFPETPKRAARIKNWLWHSILALIALGWLIPLFRTPMEVRICDTLGQTPLPPEVFQRVQKTFFPDERYVGPSNETHHHWDHLVAGHDALYVPDAEEYGLPKGIHPPFDHPGKVNGGPPQFYVVSLFHQLHCLNIVRFHYHQVKTGSPPLGDYSEEAWDVHMDHCFEYLRQAISCGSAFAIEGSSPLEDPSKNGHLASTVTGWGVEHECINFEALRAFQINQERAYNATWQNSI